jgi:hypothetical protein
MNESLSELGQKLVENSLLAEEFSAQRGLINELFPYVYEASKRMSSRAISRWLDSNGVKLSPATIAKALRKSEPYWQELAEEFEPAATIFSNAYDIAVEDVLVNEKAFDHLSAERPAVGAITQDGAVQSLDEIQEAIRKLKEEWFTLPQAARETCLGHADLDLENDNAPDSKETKVEATK